MVCFIDWDAESRWAISLVWRGSNEGIMSCLLNLSNTILIKRGRFTGYFSATRPLQERENICLITCCRWTMTAVMKSSLHSIIRGTETKSRLHWFQDDVWHCAGESLYESSWNVIKGLCFKCHQLPGSSSLLSPSIPVKPKKKAPRLCYYYKYPAQDFRPYKAMNPN